MQEKAACMRSILNEAKVNVFWTNKPLKSRITFVGFCHKTNDGRYSPPVEFAVKRNGTCKTSALAFPNMPEEMLIPEIEFGINSMKDSLASFLFDSVYSWCKNGYDVMLGDYIVAKAGYIEELLVKCDLNSLK